MPSDKHDTYWKEMEEDPDFKLCKREALIGAAVTFVLVAYVVGVVYFLGFNRSPDEYQLIFGMPDWLVLGEFLPILLLVVAAWVLSKRVMKPLAEERHRAAQQENDRSQPEDSPTQKSSR